MTRKEKAIKYFEQGYNCSQSVVIAFSDVIGIDEVTLAKMSSGLGGGVCRMREVCGAVSGMAMVIGLLQSDGTPETKAMVYEMGQEVINKFKEKTGTIICRELLDGVTVTQGTTPEARTETYYNERPCKDLVAMAAKNLDEYFRKK